MNESNKATSYKDYNLAIKKSGQNRPRLCFLVKDVLV